MIRNVLRLWAAGRVYFNRVWRIAEGGQKIRATWHEELQAYDVPRLLYVQLDYLIEKYRQELERKILRDMEISITPPRNPDVWFSFFLTAFVYLAALERDTWELETWKAKTAKFAAHPNVVAFVRLHTFDLLTILQAAMVPKWPLSTLPQTYVSHNHEKAHSIVCWMRAWSAGKDPFIENDRTNQFEPATRNSDEEAQAFAQSLSEDLRNMGK
jgi:hypothetical protein